MTPAQKQPLDIDRQKEKLQYPQNMPCTLAYDFMFILEHVNQSLLNAMIWTKKI